MSSFDEKQQGPGPSAGGVERESEPRLLTRSSPEETAGEPRRSRRGAEGAVLSERPAAFSQGPAGNGKGRVGRRKGVRRILQGLGAAAVLLCVGLLVWAASLRQAVNAALPRLDGEATVGGLRSAVMVTRDAQGVPSITAGNLHDALFAQGYVTASDRLWQMDALRRHGAGELAEILGSSMVEHDRRQRILQMRATADRALTQLPGDQRAELEAYAAGVNSYINGHRGALPVEFRLLGYKPAAWTPRDSLLILLVMFQDMSTRFPQKMDREALSRHLPADLLPDLYPVGSWRDHPPAAGDRSLSAPHAVELIPLDPSQARVGPATPPDSGTGTRELLAASEALESTTACEDCRAGSNNWAVSGVRTASGKPLLANDTHLNLLIPSAWYEMALRTTTPVEAADVAAGNLDASGFTLPGLPFVVIGRNAHVAWGVTNLGGDVQDVRVEHLRGTGAGTEFEQTEGVWAPVEHHEERIRVRGGLDRMLDVETTTHVVGTESMETPIISGLYPSDPRTLSLAWTAYAPRAVSVPLLGSNLAADGTALVQSFAGFGGPTLNLVWADTDGHIGYHAIGLVPVRGSLAKQPKDAPEVLPSAPAGPAVPDEGEGDQAPEGKPAAWRWGFARPRLTLAGYRPRRQRAAAPRRLAAPRAVRSRGRRRAPAAAAEVAAAPNLPGVTVTPTARDYTIGSRVSPVPVDALDARQAWVGYIAYADLPAVTDPAGGVLATANSRITADDYPWSVSDDWADPFRTERIVHVLSGRTGLTASDMLAMENDVHSNVDQAMGQRIAYAIDHASAGALGGDARRLHQAADLLRAWNGEMTTESSAASVITTAREALWPALLGPQLRASAAGQPLSPSQLASLVKLYSWGERTTALELLVGNQPARWLPAQFGNWNDFLATATEEGLKAAHAPSNLSRWPYGKLHTVELAHPVFGAHPLLARLLGVAGSTGQQPAPGDFTTVKAIGPHFGPSERFIADLAKDMTSWHGALGNLTTGESENGHSPWYLDQFAPWLEGTTFALPGGETPAAHTLRLVPAGGS